MSKQKKPGTSARVTNKSVIKALEAERDAALAARDRALSELTVARQDLWRMNVVADAANAAARDHQSAVLRHKRTAESKDLQIERLRHDFRELARAKIAISDTAEAVIGAIQGGDY